MHLDPIREDVPPRGPLWPQLARLFGLALLTVGLTGCFRVSSDTEALRSSLLKTAGVEWNEEIEFGVGRLTLGLARAGLSFIDLPPEGRAALEAARAAEVGVYKLQDGDKPLDLGGMLSAADETMERRGWDRIVAVLSRRELVAIYIPKTLNSTRDVEVCLAVLDGRQLVVASARSNLEPLLNLAFNRAEWLEKDRAQAQF